MSSLLPASWSLTRRAARSRSPVCPVRSLTTSESRATPSSAGPMSSPEVASVLLTAVSAFASCCGSSSSSLAVPPSMTSWRL